jgi:hypothetical protein
MQTHFPRWRLRPRQGNSSACEPSPIGAVQLGLTERRVAGEEERLTTDGYAVSGEIAEALEPARPRGLLLR